MSRFPVPALLPLAFGIASTVGLANERLLHEDASIRVVQPSAGETEWLLETSSVRWTLRLSGGQFRTTSLVNKSKSPPPDYAAGADSQEFSLVEKGTPVSGVSGGWILVDSRADSLSDGTSQLSVVLKNHSLQVTRHYLLYPGTGIAREWSTIKNVS